MKINAMIYKVFTATLLYQAAMASLASNKSTRNYYYDLAKFHRIIES